MVRHIGSDLVDKSMLNSGLNIAITHFASVLSDGFICTKLMKIEPHSSAISMVGEACGEKWPALSTLV